jgi:hypothetical protein
MTYLAVMQLALGAALVAGASYELQRGVQPRDATRGFLLLGTVWILVAAGLLLPESRRGALWLLAAPLAIAAAVLLARHALRRDRPPAG